MDGMTSRIASATQGELLVITYEITIDSIEKAIESLKANDDKQFKRYIKKTQAFLKELMNTLNLSYEISIELMQLYLFVNKSVLKGFMKKNEQPLQDSKRVLNILLDGWTKLSETHKKDQAPVIGNAQKLVAGLTYGRGTLNESVMNNGANRGYTA